MLAVNADESEKSVPRFPLKIGGSGGAHNISWMPVCLRHLVWSFWFTAGDHYTSWFMPVERSLSPIMVMPNLHFGPVCHSYLFPYFWTFWSVMGCSRPASGEWRWDLRQLAGIWGAGSCKVHHWREEEHEHRKVHCWKEEQRQVWPNSCPEKLSDGQEVCKPEIRVYVGRQTLDS